MTTQCAALWLISILAWEGLSQSRALAQAVFEAKKCRKCGRLFLTTKSVCPVDGEPFSAPPPQRSKRKPTANSKAGPTRAKTQAATASSKATVLVPAKVVGKTSTVKAPIPLTKAPPSSPGSSIQTGSPAKVKPIASVPKKPSIPTTLMRRSLSRPVKPVVPAANIRLNIPEGSSQTGLPVVDVLASANSTRRLSSLEIRSAFDGREITLVSCQGASLYLQIGVKLRLDAPDVSHRLWAIAVDDQGTIYKGPESIVTRIRQNLPRPSIGGGTNSISEHEIYRVERDGKEKKIDPKDPLIPTGNHSIRFYAPNRQQKLFVSRPLDLRIDEAGFPGAMLKVELDSIGSDVSVKVMRGISFVNQAVVELIPIEVPAVRSGLLRSDELSRRLTLSSGTEGLYVFPRTPVGKYKVTVDGKQHQEMQVTGESSTAQVTVTLPPPMLTVVTEIVSHDGKQIGRDDEIVWYADSQSGETIRFESDKPTSVPNGKLRFNLRGADQSLWQSTETAGPEVAVHDGESRVILQLTRRRTRVEFRFSSEDGPFPKSLVLKPSPKSWLGSEPVEIAIDPSSGIATAPAVQVGDYLVELDSAWEISGHAKMLHLVAQDRTQYSITKVRADVQIAITHTGSQEPDVNADSIRFDVLNAVGSPVKASLSPGQVTLPVGMYRVRVDPKSIPPQWQLAPGEESTKTIEIPLDKKATFAFVSRRGSILVQGLWPSESYQVVVDEIQYYDRLATSDGQMQLDLIAGSHEIKIAHQREMLLDPFTTQVNIPSQSTVTAVFLSVSNREAEITILAGQPIPRRRSRVDVVIDYPSNPNWIKLLKHQGITLPVKLIANTNAEGKIILAKNAPPLPPAPYQVSVLWMERNLKRDDRLTGSMQDIKFNVLSQEAYAKAEVRWRERMGTVTR